MSGLWLGEIGAGLQLCVACQKGVGRLRKDLYMIRTQVRNCRADVIGLTGLASPKSLKMSTRGRRRFAKPQPGGSGTAGTFT